MMFNRSNTEDLNTGTWRVLEKKEGFLVQRTVETTYYFRVFGFSIFSRIIKHWANMDPNNGTRPEIELFPSLEHAYKFITGINKEPRIHPYPSKTE